VVGFLTSLGLGIARLGLGLWGIARLRTRSLPIDDREMNEMVEVLRAELGCTQCVQVRELTDLATPATVGWRRPLLPLPATWRDWSAAERRAVLAHELAHVFRSDFLCGVAAQLSLALHFYHPLAHWLAARLRLEQELAADAWGAQLSGGKSDYLAILAQMALRGNDRVMTWSARAFLPSHGTFVRRIEMLRKTNSVRQSRLTFRARVVTVGVLSVLGLVIAGLRGPVGESPAKAQDQAIAQPSASNARATGESYDLRFLPADAKMILAVRPGSLIRRRHVLALVESIRKASPFMGVILTRPEEVEQLLLFWPGETQAASLPPPSGLVLRLTKPQDGKFLRDQVIGPDSQEARHDGQTYIRTNPNAPSGWGIYIPDDRTLVAAPEELLRELIEDRNVPVPRHSWDEAWNQAAKGQFMLSLETRWLRRRIAQARAGERGGPWRTSDAMLQLETFSPLLDKARSYALGVTASDSGLAMDLVATVGSESDGKPVAETLQAVVTLSKNTVEGLRRNVEHQPGAQGEGLDWLLQAACSLLDRAQVERSASLIRLRTDASVDLAEGIKLLVPAVSNARAASNRATSVNNLKQIGLAFHNYVASNNHFPAAVNLGGKSKSIPYSWRVAILPFIEQQELYNVYNFDEPWDGPNNRKLIDRMPAVFRCSSSDGTPSSRTNSSYFVFTGPATAVGAGTEPKLPDFTDGTSNTILAVEAVRDIPWTKPEDIPFDTNGPLPELGGFWEDGFSALFADGSVRYLKKSIRSEVLKALITRAGGEVISSDSY
jgi:hypothetical protein